MGVCHADPERIPREPELYTSKVVYSICKRGGHGGFTTILRALCTLYEGTGYGEDCLCDDRGRLLSLPPSMQRFETDRLYDKAIRDRRQKTMLKMWREIRRMA